ALRVPRGCGLRDRGARLMDFNFTILGFNVAHDVVLLGIITGMLYGLLGVGLILIYRSSGVINFAYGEIGAFGAAVLGAASINTPIPYWVLFIIALLVSALISVVSDRVIISKFKEAPEVVSVIATLGLGAVLTGAAVLINASVGAGQDFPQPPGFPEFDVG